MVRVRDHRHCWVFLSGSQGSLLGDERGTKFERTFRLTPMTIETDRSQVMGEIRAGAVSLRAIAAGLNARGTSTAQGKAWSAMQVKWVLERTGASNYRLETGNSPNFGGVPSVTKEP
jgi:hypothetical protein